MSFDSHKPRVLIVEDEVLTRMDLAQEFQEAGFAVIEARDGMEAAEVLKSGVQLDLVLSDVRLPGETDGVEIGRLVREKHPEAKFVLMSGNPLMAEARDLPDEFLSKPLDARAVARRLRSSFSDPHQWKNNNSNAS